MKELQIDHLCQPQESDSILFASGERGGGRGIVERPDEPRIGRDGALEFARGSAEVPRGAQRQAVPVVQLRLASSEGAAAQADRAAKRLAVCDRTGEKPDRSGGLPQLCLD